MQAGSVAAGAAIAAGNLMAQQGGASSASPSRSASMHVPAAAPPPPDSQLGQIKDLMEKDIKEMMDKMSSLQKDHEVAIAAAKSDSTRAQVSLEGGPGVLVAAGKQMHGWSD